MNGRRIFDTVEVVSGEPEVPWDFQLAEPDVRQKGAERIENCLLFQSLAFLIICARPGNFQCIF